MCFQVEKRCENGIVEAQKSIKKCYTLQGVCRRSVEQVLLTETINNNQQHQGMKAASSSLLSMALLLNTQL